MKTILVTIMIILSHSIFAQTVKATKQKWAGGICCRTGVNYIVVLSWEQEEEIPKKILVDSICIDGMRFDAGRVTMSKAGNTVTFKFGYSQDQEGRTAQEVKYLPPVTKSENALFWTIGEEQIPVKIEQVEELMYLAYP